jgi:anthranilate 1,2-dioxygenase large subunit
MTAPEGSPAALDTPHEPPRHEPWPAEGLTRIPYWVFQREDVYAQEQARVFQGPAWSFLCLEVEVAGP